MFERHDPFNNVGHTQYMNGVWYHDDAQFEALRRVMNRQFDTEPENGSVQTRIEPLETFYRAEDYHQKYHLRQHDRYMAFFRNCDPGEFTDSTAAARLNGILAGGASSLAPYDSLGNLDLSERLRRDLQSRTS